MKKHGALAPTQQGGPVVYRVLGANPEGTMMQMGFDYSKADVPDRAYYSDYCDIVRDRCAYTLVFGKLVPDATKLRTKIEISFPEEMFIRQVWAGSREFHRIVGLAAARTPALTPIANVGDTDKVQTFRANNVFMGTFGEESVLDFYYLSPREMNDATSRMRQGNVMLEPVIRVAMGIGLMFEFLEKLGKLNLDEALKRYPENKLGLPSGE